ncbi:lysine-specific demethylase 5A-like [Uloborus diversus]|uniref:lysine-specific demethylase 5A-like n=1 Tax=Uloborus diversus TaxID=327109 RepID=UPI0024096685|nr:lysine-specific demethylase 5A-like [Uloborus diversus]
MNAGEFEFRPPPEAPVYEPTAEEFKDPLAYIAKIRPEAEQRGICKIKPPPEWQPPFAVDVDNFRFTPRMQRLNELEATTRIKLNFLDQIAKFWELQGSSLRIPNVERKALDLFTLYRVVQEEGGMDIVSRERRWSRIATRMGYPPGRGVGSLLRQHYERILYPYDVFQSGASLNDISLNEDSDDSDKRDKDYIPHGIPSRQAIRPPADRYARRSKRCGKDSDENIDGIDYSTNNELKKLQFYGAGPKMPGYHSQGKYDFEEESKFLKENHIECLKDLKMGLGAKDLKMGFGNKLSGNFLKETRTMSAVEAAKLGAILKRKDRPKGKMPIDQIVCNICNRGDEEASMLLCDGCDDSYHTFCLIPPLNEIPKGDWRCPRCVAQEVCKPQEAFGFEQAQREYTLQEFGLKADEFKTNYFNMPVHRVPFALVEKEFWRIVNAVDEDVTVEYGADLHTIDHGSGFPSKKTKTLLPGDEEYVTSGWNLNNLPVLEGSVLKHINADISGMKIPWTYVGMCFATFCWHNEDHWSYSINYLHWGEPKTWYGVPGGAAECFEDAMRSVAPELFDTQPDLLHQLVTIMNPNLLENLGVPIVRTNQQAGEFVITFPRSYHAGFNQGYNFAEAVNFAPADWLPIGRVCVSHYGMLHRFCVFSHDELICKMASDPDRLDISIAASTYQDMLRMVESEKELRKSLLEWGVAQANREVFELIADDERQCEYCKTTCFLSAVTCSCSNNKLVCIPHKDKLCRCPPDKHCLLYRYTLDELPTMLHRLKVRAESFDTWSTKVKNALNAPLKSKLSLTEFKEFIQEAEEKRFPPADLLNELIKLVEEAEQCSCNAQKVLSKQTPRKRAVKQTVDYSGSSLISHKELQILCHQIQTLPCEIKEAFLIKDLLDRTITFRSDASELINEEISDSRKLEKYLEIGLNLHLNLAEIPQLKQKLQQSRWLEEVRASLIHPDLVTLEVLKKLLEKGINIPPHCTVEKVLAELQELLTMGERWEEKAKLCLQARPKHPLAVLESVLGEAGSVSVYLPNVLQLTDAVKKAKDWIAKVQAVQSGAHNPYLEVLEYLVTKGRPIPIHLEQLSQIEAHVEAAKAWREKTARTFLKKNSCYNLIEVLSPRKDIGAPPAVRGKKKKSRESEDGFGGDDSMSLDEKFEEAKDPATIVANFKEAERLEIEAMMQLRAKNIRARLEDSVDSRYCICHKPLTNNMLQCELCKDWFHMNCIPLPKSASAKKQSSGMSSTALAQLAKEVKFLCPLCLRSRRPRLETILSLLVSLQKLPVRLPEGEALQCLTERGMSWQDRARQALATDELAAALAKLSLISQRIVEQAAREKTEKIICTELRKAASNPELKPHLQNVAHTAFGGLKIDELSKWSGNVPCPQTSQESYLPTHSEGSEDNIPVVAAVQEVPSGESSSNVEVDPNVGIAADAACTRDGSNASDTDVPANYNMEHAYSTASKAAAATTPRKHARKSPLVTRQMESPVLQLSDAAKNQLEHLMMEGDLLEMSLDETQHIWSILQATKLGRDSFSMSPFSDVEDNTNNVRFKTEKKKIKKRKLDDTKGNLMKSKIAKTKSRLKIQLKENKQKKKKLRLGGKIFGPHESHSSASTGSAADGNIKHKKLKSKMDFKDARREGTFHFKKEMKDGTIKTVKMRSKIFDKSVQKKIRKPNTKGRVERKVHSGKGESRENEPDDRCSASNCLRPTGDAVNWVQCDGGCEQWFHLLCVGLDMKDVSESEDYICLNCGGRNHSFKEEGSCLDISTESQQHSKGSFSNSEVMIDFESASEVAVSVLAGFAKNSFAAERMSNQMDSTSKESTDYL